MPKWWMIDGWMKLCTNVKNDGWIMGEWNYVQTFKMVDQWWVDDKFTVIVFNNGLWFQTRVELGANKRWMHEDYSCMCVLLCTKAPIPTIIRIFLLVNLHWDSPRHFLNRIEVLTFVRLMASSIIACLSFSAASARACNRSCVALSPPITASISCISNHAQCPSP